MAVGVEAAVESVEIEAFSTEIPSLIPMSKSLYSLARDRFTKVPVSYQTYANGASRPSFRVPFRVQGGAAIQQGTGDGTALGLGNMSVWQDFSLSPVWNFSVNQMSHLSQLAVNGKKRGLISLKAEELKNSLDSTMAGLEGLMYGDGSGLITQIPTTATVNTATTVGPGNIVGVRAMAFTDNQIVAFFTAEGTSSYGYATVSVNDPVTSTLYFYGGLATGSSTLGSSLSGTVAAGDYMMVYGANGSATAGNGIIGTTGWINSAASGTIAGINRATYPSRISSPSINLNGGSVVASLSQRIEALLGRAMGGDNKTKDSGIYIFGEDQSLAVAQTNYYNKQITQNSDTPGPSGKVPDTSRKYFQGTFGGRDVHLSYVQPLGRIDMLLTSEWYIGELCPLQLYDFGGGNTVMPVPAGTAAGGWLTSTQFVYEVSFNLACAAPRHQLYVYNCSQPTI
jgi:hypothetical protein